MRREKQTRLYRQQWLSFLREQIGGVKDLTPALVTALWSSTLENFIKLPVDQRPLAFDKEHKPLLDDDGEIRHVDLSDLFTQNGTELLEDLTAAEIIRSDDHFMPELKVKKEKDKELQEVLNLTFDHPDHGRRRFGLWTPFDAARYVTPKLTAQGLALAQRSNHAATIIARCKVPDIAIIEQINAEPDAPTPGFV